MSIEAGNLLRETREQKGVSIKEASDALHIRIPYLQALENGRAEIIPSAVQARGFLRIYSEYLNLNAADMIQEWDHPGTSPLTKPRTSDPEPAPPAAPFQETPQEPFIQPEPIFTQPQYIPVQPPAPETAYPIPPSGYTPDVIPPSESGEHPAAAGIHAGPEKGKKKDGREKKKTSLFGKKSGGPTKAPDPETTAQELFNDIGRQLEYRRKMLALSLEDCESQTLIRSIYIESMEKGNFEQLPSFIQARGMLNNYASFLDLDVDAIMLKLATALQLLSQKKNNRGDDKKRRPAKPAGRLRKFFTPDLFVGVFVIVGIAGIIIYSAITITAYRRNMSQPTPDLGISLLDQFLDTTRTPEFLPTSSPTASLPQANTGMESEFEPNEQSQESQEVQSLQPVQVFITANQRTLMTVKSDGKEVFNGRTLPNNTYPFDAENLIELTTGNADALSVVYNQQNLGRLGKLGENITIVFSPFMAATPTPQFSPTPTNTYEPTYTPQPETPLPTNTPTPYIP